MMTGQAKDVHHFLVEMRNLGFQTATKPVPDQVLEIDVEDELRSVLRFFSAQMKQ